MLLKFGLILIGIVFLIGQFARQFRNKRDAKMRKEKFSLGLTGKEFAERILEVKGIEDVEVIESTAMLTNHYDPQRKQLRLAPENYREVNIAAAGYAAHEVGHAIQHHQRHLPLHWRQSAIKFTLFGMPGSFILLLPICVIMPRFGLLILGAVWALIRLYNVLTLPNEFDASGRAKDVIYNARIVKVGKEFDKLEEMLHAASLEKINGFWRFWSWLASWIFPWMRPKS